MQKPLNASERNSAFWKFFLFFMLSVAMVTAAVYFNFIAMPQKENKILKEKAELMRIQNLEQEKITNNLIEAKALIDSVGKPGVNNSFITTKVGEKLAAITSLNAGDSSIQKRMNNVILSTFFALNKLKSESLNMGDNQAQIADLQSQNEKLKTQLSDCQMRIGILQASPGVAR
jgi:Type VI secretion system, TssO